MDEALAYDLTNLELAAAAIHSITKYITIKARHTSNMPYLTATDATPVDSHRFYAELASTKLDPDGVPEYFRIIDIVVAEPSSAAIERKIASRDWLKDYSLVSYWQQSADTYTPF